MILQLSAALGNMMINLNYLYRELLNTANCSILLPIFLFHTHFHCPFSRSLFSFTLICLIGLRLLCRRRRCYFFFRVCIPFIIIIKYERAKWCTYAAHLVSFQCGLRINNGISLWLNSVCGTVFSVQCSLTCSYIPMSYIFIYK